MMVRRVPTLAWVHDVALFWCRLHQSCVQLVRCVLVSQPLGAAW